MPKINVAKKGGEVNLAKVYPIKTERVITVAKREGTVASKLNKGAPRLG